MNRIGYIAGILILLSTVLIYATRKTELAAPIDITQKIHRVTITNTDTDSDTLKDWEETLWGTDPKVKDTDGDGTNDGEEVLVGRDPKVKGPGDILDNEVKNGLIQPIATVPKENVSKNGGEIPKNSEKRAPVADPKKKFANSLATLINSFTQSTQNDVKALDMAIKQPSSENISALKKVSDRYVALSTQVKALQWVNGTENPQNGLVQSYLSIGNAFEALSSYKNVGKIPVEAVKQYNQVSLTQLEALVDIAHFFKNQGITFTSSDSGYIFVNLSAIIKK